MSDATADYEEDLEVLVVGAGQAALATGFFLQRSGVNFRLFDRAVRVGDSWRRRYDSLVLFSPRDYSGLPGLAMDGNPDGYASKNEIADYLERYARANDLPTTMGEGVAGLSQRHDGFIAMTDRGRRVFARAVVVAAGPFQRGIVPSYARRLSAGVVQLAADAYRNPGQVPDARVLVVGGGATGRQIAHELASSHDVSLSSAGSAAITPQRVLGRDIMAWFDTLGFLRADKATVRGRLLLRRGCRVHPVRDRVVVPRGVRPQFVPLVAGSRGSRRA